MFTEKSFLFFKANKIFFREATEERCPIAFSTLHLRIIGRKSLKPKSSCSRWNQLVLLIAIELQQENCQFPKETWFFSNLNCGNSVDADGGTPT